MSSYLHLHDAVKEKTDLTIDERIHFIRQSRWIGYPIANNIFDKLEDLLTHPKVHRMPGMLIIGKPNNGKTHLVRKFCENHPPDENLNGDHIKAPVVFCEAPPSPNEGEFYGQILRSLYERVPSSSKEARRNRVIEVLGDIQTKVLIIDELHNVLAGTSTKQQQFLNMIKFLSNTLKICIVGCGTEDLKRAVRIDDQIESRLPVSSLPDWKNDIDFRRLLASFENIIPLKEASNLSSKVLSKKIFFMTEGIIGEVSKLINQAAIYSLKNGKELIDENSLTNCDYQRPSKRREGTTGI